jgi:hypothetical protein
MTKKRVVALGATLAVAAGVLATSAFALVGGTPDGNGHPYVGALATRDGRLCSGTALSATVMVTAAHCFGAGEVVAISTAEHFHPTTFGVVIPHPGWVATSGGGNSGSDLNDVAVVKVVGGLPLPGPYGALPPGIGYDDSLPNNQPIENLGYGVQDATTLAGAGSRVVADEKIIPGGGKTGADFLKISGGNTCFGDSGGPNLQAGTNIVLAINSYGPSASCNAVSYSQRLDTPSVYGFISHFLG